VVTYASQHPLVPRPARQSIVDVLIRSALFIAAFLSVATSLHPFLNLAEPPRVTDVGDPINQIGFSGLFVAIGAWVYFHQPGRLMPLLRPALLAVLGWCVITIFTSWEPELAARRLAFALVVMSIAAMLLLLPRNLRHFGDLLAAVALIALVVCYLGVVLVPNLAIHQASDFVEPALVGDWRGMFSHKNGAGSTMVLFIFIGLFVARVRSLVLGAVIVILAATFLIFTHSKTALALVLPVLLISAIVARCRPAVGITVVLGTLVVINLFSIGSIFFESIGDVLGTILVDPSFTGRTDIWQFALQHVAQRPITGYGFASFWGSAEVVYGMGGGTVWGNAAAQAHNSYLNTALTIGIPGSALTVLWLVVLPLVDYYRSATGAANFAPRLLFLRTCLYGACTSSFESVFFEMSAVWFMLLIAVFGLRLLSVMSLETSSPARAASFNPKIDLARRHRSKPQISQVEDPNPHV
jgi:O-antigen ligase